MLIVRIVLCLILWWGSTLGWAAAAPQAVLPETTHDFGEVFQDRKLAHTFDIKNIGDEVLEIRDIDPDCACTAADFDHRIPPGGLGRITLTIAPYSVLRQFTKKTRVSFNDPDHPEMVLTLKGYGKPSIEVQPSHIVRLQGKAGEELRSQVVFTSHLSSPWDIVNFKTNIPQFIDVAVKAKEPGRVYVVEVRNKRKEAGNYTGKIELSTTSPKRPRLILRVLGELSPPSASGQ